MRRPAIMLCLLLALGLSTSLLVAWAGALVDRGGWPRTPLTGAPAASRVEMRGWLVEEGRDQTLTWRTFAALDLHMEPPDPGAPARPPAWSVGHGLADQPGPFAPARERTRDMAWEVSAGWPVRCVRATRGAGPAEFALHGEFVRGGLAAMAYGWPTPTTAVEGHERIRIHPWPIDGLAATLPLRPMVGGLLANTLAHALVWCVLLLPLCLVGPLRRQRRRRKNRCAQCGHARDGLPIAAPCAECGRDPGARTPLPAMLAARTPMRGAALALILVLSASAALLTHRWMAVDRLPPLHHAAAVGDVERIERLIAAGAGVDEVHLPAGVHGGIENESMPLDWAAARGHDAACHRLLERGAGVGGANPWNPPLHAAMRGRHEAVVALLLAKSIGSNAFAIETDAMTNASLPIIERVLADQPRSQFQLIEAGIEAVIAVDIELLDRLIAAGADLRRDHAEELYKHAIAMDARAWRWNPPHDLGLTRALLERHTRTTRAPYVYEVATAIDQGCLPCVEALIGFGAEPATDLLYEAVRSGDAGIVALLIDAGGSPDAPDRFGRTLLWYAALSLKPDIVRVLLEAGGDPTREVGGMTMREALTHGDVAFLGTFWEVPPEQRAARPDDVRRICDLLEAAELEWNARAEPDAAPPTPGGP